MENLKLEKEDLGHKKTWNFKEGIVGTLYSKDTDEDLYSVLASGFTVENEDGSARGSANFWLEDQDGQVINLPKKEQEWIKSHYFNDDVEIHKDTEMIPRIKLNPLVKLAFELMPEKFSLNTLHNKVRDIGMGSVFVHTVELKLIKLRDKGEVNYSYSGTGSGSKIYTKIPLS